MKKRILPLFWVLLLLPASGADILFLLEKGFNRQEFYDLYLPLRALGYEIDVASTEAGTVYQHREGVPDQKRRDVPANRAMRDVKDLSGYRALVIPGGYSPGFLESNPDAIRITKAFAENPKQWTAAICHGPRVLLAAGSLEGRIWTGLHHIASEKPNDWIRPERGAYIDQQVVKDQDLLTSRYPQDTPVLARRLAEELAGQGGRPLPEKTGMYALLIPEGMDGHIRWSLTSPLKTLGFQLVQVTSVEKIAEKSDASIQGVIRFRIPEEEIAEVPNPGNLPFLDLKIPEGEFTYPDLLVELLEFTNRFGVEAQEQPVDPPQVAIVLAEGVDEKVVLAMQTYYEAQGQAVVLTGLQTGWVKGLSGLPLLIEVPIRDLKDLEVVVAPGGLWPEKTTHARQGDQADWIEEQGKKDVARQEWILAQLDDGSDLVLVGLDALRIGRESRFKGVKFSSTQQARWSFGKTGGRFSSDPFLRSSDQIWSIRGYEALPLWIHAQHLSE